MNLPTHHGFLFFAGLTRSWCRGYSIIFSLMFKSDEALIRSFVAKGGRFLLTGCHGYHHPELVAKVTPSAFWSPVPKLIYTY